MEIKPNLQKTNKQLALEVITKNNGRFNSVDLQTETRIPVVELLAILDTLENEKAIRRVSRGINYVYEIRT